jgi:hypothetical protein
MVMRRSLSTLVVFAFISLPVVLSAQGDGPRFYWKALSGTNAIPLIGASMNGNANPFDPSHKIEPGVEFSGTMLTAGYAKVLPLFGRTAIASVLLPMGRLSSEVTTEISQTTTTARGFGDPMMQLNINLIGPAAINSLPDMLRYEPGFSVDLLASLAIPVGEYDNTSPINLGQNRWYGRLGVPVIWQIGSWVPGRRVTIEALPAMWLFGDNTDFVGKTMSTEPMYQVEGHLTFDIMERLWGSLDAVGFFGGAATIDTVKGASLSNIGVGGTLGMNVNENLQVMIAYNSTINDSEPEDLKMDSFRATVTYGWHALIEGMRRLKGND